MSTITPERADLERDRIRTELNRRRMARAASALIDSHATERQLEREAMAEVRRDGKITTANAANRRAMREQSIARRRDAWRRALAYPMSGAELIAACQHATLAAKVPAESFEDASQALAAHVIRRHGPEPLRAAISADWLRQRALAIYIDQRRDTERATGARAAAEELADWGAQDHRAAMAEAAASGDLVWALASNRPAPEQPRTMAPAAIARALKIPERSAGARSLAQAIDPARRRALTGAERVAWHSVRAALRNRYSEPHGLLLAIRPDGYAAELIADAAIAAERTRAAVTSRGGSSASYWAA